MAATLTPLWSAVWPSRNVLRFKRIACKGRLASAGRYGCWVRGRDGGVVPDVARGTLLSLEGGEGTGKTTQCALLVAWLNSLGIATASTREPGGTPAAERIRSLLLDPGLEPLEPAAEVLLFAASRAQAVAQIVSPALAAGCVVVCDRFVDSSMAYQGYGLGVSTDFILEVNDRVTGALRPDLTLLFDLPPAAGRARKATTAHGDRIEARADAYHRAVRAGYLALARQEPARFRVVDAAPDVATVQQTVRRFVGACLWGPRGLPDGPGQAPGLSR